ncbi:MAG: S-layer homology domain-containing protein [Clostridia bacterium]|nr:S-layer homology domain-containing protein [Clostridia bacterium]
MRNLKKFLALVLAMLMVFSMAVISTGAATKDADYTDAAHHLAALKILKGDEKGNLNLDNGVTRWQAALFFVQALTGKTDASTWNADKSAYFTDVPEYGTAIDYAYGINLIVGRGNGVYGYADAITYQDMLVMAVRALGYETEDMVYPSGYTIAAQKLGLTDNIDVTVNFKDTLTRGETAQIIWDMLQTEVAYTDLLTGNIVYPSETGALEMILNASKGDDEAKIVIERTTLLEESGFADGEIVGTIVEFIEADEDENDYEEDMVLVEADVDLYIKAADLGITAETKPSTYLGLPVTLYVDCAAADFAEEYADEEATVVFADYEEYTVVENLGDAGNIKVVVKNGDPENAKTYISLGGTKFTFGKYYPVVKTWQGEDGWATDASVWPNAFASFVYDDGAYVGNEKNPYASCAGYDASALNTYGKVAYRVTDEETEDGQTIVEVLYTPYEFGQYNVLTTKDATTSKDADFATYTNGLDDQMYLFGSDKKVSDTTTSVSKANGEKAKSVTIEGEEVECCDFMFYSYNAEDNVLTVAKNCGTYAHGRLTGYSDSKETAKIGGVSYKFGFDGLYTAEDQVDYDKKMVTDYIAALEKGENNVKYLAVDGKLVYVGDPDEEESGSAGAFDFVIATTDVDVVADLLEVDADDYVDALVGTVADVTAGVYVDENGYVAIAVLDLTTGQWTLGSLKSLSISYDKDDEKFTNAVDLATYAKFAEIGQLADDVQAKYNKAAAALEGNLFALVSEKDGVYTLGAATNYGVADDVVVDAYAPFATAPATKGVVFNTTGRTNLLSIPGTEDDDGDYDSARITMGADTVVVALFADGAVGVRVGATKNDSNNIYNIGGGSDSVLLSANASLIVIDTQYTSEKISGEANRVSFDDWNTTNIGGTTNYYVVLADSSVDVDEEDDETVYTVNNVYDIRNKTVVDITSTNDIGDVVPGDILYLRSTGEIDASSAQKKNTSFFNYGDYFSDGKANGALTGQGAIQGIYFTASTRCEAKNIKTWGNKFVDGETMVIMTNASTAKVAETLTITSLTGNANTFNYFGAYSKGNNVGLDQDDYDFEAMVLATPIARYSDIAKEVETDEYYGYIKNGIDLIELSEDEIVAFVENPVDGQEYYFVTYALTTEYYESFNEPTEGVFNQFMIDHSGSKLLVPANDADDYTDSAEVYVVTSMSSYVSSTNVKLSVINLLVDDLSVLWMGKDVAFAN